MRTGSSWNNGSTDGRMTLVRPQLIVLALLACDGSSTETMRPTEIAISAEAEVVVGQSIPLAAAVKDQLGAVMPGHGVTWISLTPTTAVIENDSLLRGRAPGEAVVQATAGTATAQVIVAVRPMPVASVIIIPADFVMTQFHTHVFTAMAFDERGVALPPGTASWTSSDATKIVVEALSPGALAAYIRGRGTGRARITVTIDGVSGYSDVLVLSRFGTP